MSTTDLNDGIPPSDDSHDFRERLETAISTGNILFPVSAGISYGIKRDYSVTRINIEDILELLTADIQLVVALCDQAMADMDISLIEMEASLSSTSQSSIYCDFCFWSEVLDNRGCVLTHEGNMSYARENSRLRKMRMDSRAKNIADLQILCESEALIFFLEDLIKWTLHNNLCSEEKLTVRFELKFSSDVVRTKL